MLTSETWHLNKIGIMSDRLIEDIKGHVVDVPDFPRPGILFKDIMPLFRHPDLVKNLCQRLADMLSALPGGPPDVIIGIEARGFLIAPLIAQILNSSLVVIRKKGKLPRECISVKYEKEYGADEFDLQKDAFQAGQTVAIVDDLLATGGTLEAAARLTKMLGGVVSAHVVVFELEFLEGRKRLGDTDVISLVKY